MSDAPARMTFGVPVRNGMPLLAEALAAVAGQTLRDIEVVVSDNASTDGTAELCAAAAAADARLRVLTQPRPLSASDNFNATLRACTTQYFSWAAHDDRFDAAYAERCSAALDADPTIDACTGTIAFIDEHGRRIGAADGCGDLASHSTRRRLRTFLARTEWLMLYAVFRTGTLRDQGGYRPGYGGDVVTLWGFALGHRMRSVPEVVLEYRRYRHKSLDRIYGAILPGAADSVPAYLHLRLWRAMWRRCGEDDVSPASRRTGRRELIRWLPSASFRFLFFDDLKRRAAASWRVRHRIRAAGWLALMLCIQPSRTVRGVRRVREVAA